MTKEIRTRIAPSPTGMMHLGTARTAIYCWAYARHFIGGKFLLRIEDTDQERSTQEAVDVILDGMKWLELDYDEGPIFQMDRLDRYKEVVDEMLEKGLAYKCYATKEELDALREEQMANKQKPRYDGRWRPENAVGREIPDGVTPVIRFRNPDTGTVTWKDQVYGEISFENTELDDLVIMRGDGIPTYNFAVVVDDLDMKVSHVVRGADHINNTPRQINLYHALGAEVPEFAHLPLINGPDNKKLSKRNGDASVMDYELKGYLPEAVVNYLARLGWGHGNDEKFSKAQLAEWFDLENCSKSPACLDPKKLNHLNHLYMAEADNDRLARLVRPRIEARGGVVEGKADLAAVMEITKQRPETLEALADVCMIFYRPLQRDEALVREVLANEQSLKAVQLFLERAREVAEWTPENIYLVLKGIMDEMGIKMPVVAVPIRVLVFGEKISPVFDKTLALFGKETVLANIESGLAML
ncbi:MAG: glutamate--tRNA ligase [Burkholderiaceae bacterium]|nr:glutamate--tRNA ligase [Burkholderiaceae bacterium]